MPYVYILRCSDGTYYTGSAVDLERRLAKHRSGKGARYTRQRLPVRLCYFEERRTMGDALRREREIQGWSRARKKALMDAAGNGATRPEGPAPNPERVTARKRRGRPTCSEN